MKCSACQRFMTQNAIDGIKCNVCSSMCHKACLGMKTKDPIPKIWTCPDCVVNMPKGNNQNTPVRSMNKSIQMEMDKPTNTEQINIPAVDNTTSLDANKNLAMELRMFREEMCKTKSELRTFCQEVQDLKALLRSYDERIGNLETRIDIIEKQAKPDHSITNMGELEKTIHQLKFDLRERDQDLLGNDIEISGIPEDCGESTMHIVTACAKKIGVELDIVT
ncbi:unnamed protein product [Parnassius mnemosyne]|uniref:Phorbol-ester/DAG-type domain-containing protein n=1 Tax=Parnassius mnemosyne TaxID=213953 RepID=A0AAV1LUG9_9NEOP